MLYLCYTIFVLRIKIQLISSFIISRNKLSTICQDFYLLFDFLINVTCFPRRCNVQCLILIFTISYSTTMYTSIVAMLIYRHELKRLSLDLFFFPFDKRNLYHILMKYLQNTRILLSSWSSVKKLFSFATLHKCPQILFVQQLQISIKNTLWILQKLSTAHRVERAPKMQSPQSYVAIFCVQFTNSYQTRNEEFSSRGYSRT